MSEYSGSGSEEEGGRGEELERRESLPDLTVRKNRIRDAIRMDR
jgi:hypothetical protein